MVLYLLATNTINFIFAKQVMGICAPTQIHFPKEIRREEDWKR
jgi:hypothetical protein